MIDTLSENEEKYLKFYEAFSKNIKLGVHEETKNKDKLAKFLRFQSTNSEGKLISLDN